MCCKYCHDNKENIMTITLRLQCVKYIKSHNVGLKNIRYKIFKDLKYFGNHDNNKLHTFTAKIVFFI